MLLQKACKILGSLNKPLWVVACTTICLCWPTDIKSQGIQQHYFTPPTIFAPPSYGYNGQYNEATIWGRPQPGRCGPQGCPSQQGFQSPRPQRPAQPPRRAPDARQGGQRHPSEVRVRAVVKNVSQLGWGSFVTYKGKQYLISCAHVFKPGWTSYAIVNGKDIELTLLTAGRIADITVWSAPAQHPNPLSLAPQPAKIGTAVTVAGNSGTVLGYVGSDIEVRASVKEGDSGGPIFSSQGLVAILTEYAPTEGKCIGPNVLLISALLDSLAGPPQEEERPMVPVQPPEVVVEPFDDADIRARLTALEGNAKINKDEIELHGKRIAAIEGTARENTILIQRVTGVAESLQREVVQNSGAVDALSTKTRDLTIRVQRMEQTTTTLSNTLKGKMQFRLRIDQAGRVTGVEPR